MLSVPEMIEDRIATGDNIQNRGFLLFWLVSLATLLGIISIWSGQRWVSSVCLPIGYGALLLAFVRTTLLWNDLFNPLNFILVIGFIRFSCPGFLVLSGLEPPEEVRLFFQAMGLSESDWRWGHALALTGILTVVFGWLLIQGTASKGALRKLNFHLPSGVKYTALGGMLIGFMALAAFVVRNASLDVITSGGFRETTIQTGTGKFFFLAYLLLSGSVVLSCYFLVNRRPLISLAPVGGATLVYWVLGGRSRAMMPLACGLLLIWYFLREKKRWPKVSVGPAVIFSTPLILLLILWISYLGALYRGEGSAQAFSAGLSIAGLWQYIQASVFTDLGQLHSLAGAIAIGPGVLRGQTFIGSLTWPLYKFFPMPGRSAGVYIVETLVGFTDDDRWAVNASLIGDAYLNFGFWGVVVVMMTYGVLLKILYTKFRQGGLPSAVYVLALVHGLQIFWGSIEVWPQTLTVLAFTYGLITAGKIIMPLRSGRGSSSDWSSRSPWALDKIETRVERGS